ncbi:hypothetical protein LIER_40747 [Lithospermum erythrorhizon]|uniref:Uncharacterized protein n=1 Tax=Lithospermum erythrorhizon TaxID=34254 RepID=A0AAV3R381_LITER
MSLAIYFSVLQCRCVDFFRNTSRRIASLCQLSNIVAQFKNLQSPAKPRKPLTKKDAQVLNEWRFSKMAEFKDGEVGAENEAFDRYLRNVSFATTKKHLDGT